MLKHVATDSLTRFNEFVVPDIEFIRWNGGSMFDAGGRGRYLLVGIAFPLLFWQSILIGSEGSPDAITRRNGILMAQALNAFYADNHVYPTALEQLAPTYLAKIPDDPQSPGGWLYKLSSESFILGYVSWVDRFGYSVCVLMPRETDWNCSPTSNGEPFNLGPTPVPTRTRMP